MQRTKENNIKNSEETSRIFSRTIRLWLDTYEDIFSDFDPRPFSERNISDDFLNEVRKVCRESEQPIDEFKLLLPEKYRHAKDEGVIIKRLHNHFRQGLHNNEKALRNIRKKAWLYLLTGMLLLLGAGYSSLLKSPFYLSKILLVLTEPAGWFFAWTGFEKIFSARNEKIPELDFYKKISKTKIVFKNLE